MLEHYRHEIIPEALPFRAVESTFGYGLKSSPALGRVKPVVDLDKTSEELEAQFVNELHVPL